MDPCNIFSGINKSRVLCLLGSMADIQRKAAGQAEVDNLIQDKSGIEVLFERLKNGLYGLLFVLGKDTALSPIWIILGELVDFVSP